MTFPDTVGLTIAYLTPRLDAHVGSRIPNPRPDRFAQVRRVGGRALPPVRDLVRLDVFTWAPSEPDAMALALDARRALWALAGTTLLGPTTYQVSEVLAPRQDDDDQPATSTPSSGGGTPRVWATYELVVRADAAIQPAPPPASP